LVVASDFATLWTVTLVGFALGACHTDLVMFLKLTRFKGHLWVKGSEAMVWGYEIYDSEG